MRFPFCACPCVFVVLCLYLYVCARSCVFVWFLELMGGRGIGPLLSSLKYRYTVSARGCYRIVPFVRSGGMRILCIVVCVRSDHSSNACWSRLFTSMAG